MSLPVVDLLLYGTGGQQAVDGDLACLTYPPGSLSCLCICGGVPVRIVNDDPVGASQVHSQSSHTRRQQEHKQRTVLIKG